MSKVSDRERIVVLECKMARLERGFKPEQKTKGMTFGEALEAMKQGKKVSCWNTDNIHIWYVEGDTTYLPRLMVKTMSGMSGAWTPNHGDILLETWRVVSDD